MSAGRLPGNVVLDGGIARNRQQDREGRSIAQPAIGIDRATVAVDDLSASGQADAGSFLLHAAMQALEDLEDLLFVGVVETNAVVTDADGEGTCRMLRQPDRRANLGADLDDR